MIHYKLLLIEVEDNFRAIKIKRQEDLVKEFAVEFAKWLIEDGYKNSLGTYSYEQLLNAFEDEKFRTNSK